jgi:hypothetical protein
MSKGSFANSIFVAALLLSGDALAVNIAVNDACGKSLSGSTGASTLVSSAGDLALSQVSGARYTAGIGQCDAVAAGDTPKCTLSSLATKTTAGSAGTVTLFAKCSASPTSFTWNVPSGGPALPSGASSTNTIDLTFTAAGSYTYSVVAANASGAGPVSTQLTILVADTSSKPACILTASPSLVQTSGKSTLQVSCHPAATAAAPYTWTADTGAPAAPASTAPSAEITFPTAGSYTYKVKGTNTAGDGPVASATVTVEAGSGSACTAGAYSLLRNTSAGASYWDNGSFGTVIVYQFVMGAGPYSYAGFGMYSRRSLDGSYLPDQSQLTISQCPGDFNVTGPCNVTVGPLDGQVMAGYTYGNPATACVLQPSTTYYFNVKVTGCMWGSCGWIMQGSY